MGKTIREIAYMKYQYDWLMEHNISLPDVMEHLARYQYLDPEDSDAISEMVDEMFNKWEQDVGFDGEIYVCFAEFLDAEYLDAEYMKALLSDEEYEKYLRDIEERNGDDK